MTELGEMRAVPLVHHEMVIDHDNFLPSVDEQGDSVDTGFVNLLGNEAGLDKLREFSNTGKRCKEVAITNTTLSDIVKTGTFFEYA